LLNAGGAAEEMDLHGKRTVITVTLSQSQLYITEKKLAFALYISTVYF